jgi:hypothetical protein
MRHAYGMDQVAFGSVLGDGTGQTIAIIDAFDQPSLAGDLAAFDRQFGLPDPPSLTKINEAGGAIVRRPDLRGGWGVESSLDVEWAHAIAPQAAILLVEANSAATSDLFAAVDTARNYPGVSVVSMSWGGDETAADSAADAHFTTPAGHTGVTFIAASGDRGAYSVTGSTTPTVLYPAASPNVVGVGGTELLTSPDSSCISETTWGNGTDSNRAGGSGGGISQYAPQPDYQQGVVTQSQTFRTVPDVAIDADPAGVPVYDSYDHGGATPWLHVGGTSLVAPLWAGIIALADQGRALDGLGTLDGRHDTLPDLYALPAGDFHDITTGSNGYTAGPGYDLATGRGTPVVDQLVHDLVTAASRPAPAPAPLTTTFISSIAPVLASGTESRYIPLGFSNWSAIQPAIAQVPMSAGQLAHVSVVNFGTTVYTGPLNVSNTINRIRADNGPITTDDGIVFTNSSHQLPPGGTYYEFNVAPRGGTDHTFTFASPGPMRLVLNTSGSLYFTGDHYSTFVPVYVHGQGSPTIGSFTISPSTVMSGDSTRLIASNVTEMGGTIMDVSFYLSGTLVGSGSRSGTTWTLPISTAGYAAGSYTFTAIATDTSGNQSAPATATLTVTRGTPTIGSFTVNPNTVQAGTPVTLTAANVTENGGTIVDVSFYLSGNLLGSGSQSGNNWSLPVATDSFTPGTYTFTAIATDDAGNQSVPATATLTVTGTGVPVIGSFTITPSTVQAGTPVTLTAASVTDTGGTVIDVSFYLSGTLVGSGSQSGNNWALTVATDSFTPDTYAFTAIATDDAGNQSMPATATLTVTGTGMPIIGSFTVTPNTVQAGTPVTLTAGNVTDTGGTIIDVSFYLSSTLLGSGTQRGNDWSFALATDGFAAGTYTLSAIATDDGGNTATAIATLTVTGTTYSGVVLGWDVNGLTNFGPQGFGATQVASGVSNSLGLTRGSGVATSQTAAANAWGGNNWAATSAAGINGNEFVTFGLTVASGNSASLSSIDLYYRRSSSGPSSGYWQYELNGGAWVTIGDFPNQFSSTSSSGAAMNELDLSGIGDLQNLAGGTVVVFRLVPYASTSSGGTWYVYDQPGNDLVINGSIQGGGGSPAISSRHHAGDVGLTLAASALTPVITPLGSSTALAPKPTADARPVLVLPTTPRVPRQPVVDAAQPDAAIPNLGDDPLAPTLLDQAMEVIAFGFPVP